MEQLKIDVGQGIDIRFNVAGLGVRSFAFVIDWHIRFILALAWLFFWFLLIDFSQSWFDNMSRLFKESSSTAYLLVFLPAMIMYFFYHPTLEILMKGQTPGKRMAKIRVVGQDGEIAGIGAHLIRNIFRLIDSLPLFYCFGVLVCLLNDRHLRIGDMAAGTIEIYVDHETKVIMDDIDHFIKDDRLDLEQRQIIRDLIKRWEILDHSMRETLSRQLLLKVGGQGSREELQALQGEDILQSLKDILSS